jgi:hypothetical protein
MQTQPVKFIAIMAHSTPAEASAYQAKNSVVMPIFADNLGLMQKRYGFEISLKNIHQTRVLSPTGTLVGAEMTKDALEKLIADHKAAWKYKGDKPHPNLVATLDLLEVSQHAAAARLLAPLRRSGNKPLAEAANKLHEVLTEEGEAWKAEAEKEAESDPIKTYDLYTQIATVFPNSELSKSTADAWKKLGADKAVKNELAARKAFAQVQAAFPKSTQAQKATLLKLCQDIVQKYGDSPTAEKVNKLVGELGG